MRVFTSMWEGVKKAVMWPSEYVDQHPGAGQIRRYVKVTKAAVTPAGKVQIMVPESGKVLDTLTVEGVLNERDAGFVAVGFNLCRDEIRDLRRTRIHSATASHRKAAREKAKADRQAKKADKAVSKAVAPEAEAVNPMSGTRTIPTASSEIGAATELLQPVPA